MSENAQRAALESVRRDAADSTLSVGDRVQDINPDRTGGDRSGVGTVTGFEIEDASTGVPTYHVQWDGASAPDAHGPCDIAPL